ncbi:MAG: signal peptidase I [Terriglobia bacterium]|jgi:signal peptidase I
MSANLTLLPRQIGLRWFLRLLERAFAIVGLLAFVYIGGFNLSAISSHSMAPTLKGESLLQGDVILSERISYRFRRPRRWELIMFRDAEFYIQVMKRVVGLPGETVRLEDKTQTIFINGTPARRPASLQGIHYLAYGNLTGGKSASSDDGYYVLGDFSMDSQDSRWTGPVKASQIMARPWLIVWPPSRIRFVNP